jgi:HAD superfamily hydrolase (TIGR01484 family)
LANFPRVIVFDLDDTLAPSKTPIEQRMADLLVRLLDRTEVCIISGGHFEQFASQVLIHLEMGEAERVRLHLMPTCGARYYRWLSSEWTIVYAEDFSEADKRRVTQVLRDEAKALGLWEEHSWGEIIEDRGSQITFSALGQKAPRPLKRGWDPDGSKRRVLCARVFRRLPGLEVRSGGSTSIDVTRKGVDKAYGIGRLLQCLELTVDDLLFIGDRLEEGGNDYPVRAMGVRCVPVSRWQDTAECIEAMLSGRPATFRKVQT